MGFASHLLSCSGPGMDWDPTQGSATFGKNVSSEFTWKMTQLDVSLHCQILEGWESRSGPGQLKDVAAPDSAESHMTCVSMPEWWCKAQRSEGDLVPCSRSGPSSPPSSAWLFSAQKSSWKGPPFYPCLLSHHPEIKGLTVANFFTFSKWNLKSASLFFKKGW